MNRTIYVNNLINALESSGVPFEVARAIALFTSEGMKHDGAERSIGSIGCTELKAWVND